MSKVTFGTYTNVLLSAPSTTSPAVSIPANVTSIDVYVTRDNWPSAGADLELQFSYDGGTTFITKVKLHVDPFVATTKQPTPTPATIGWSWNPAIFGQPSHVRGKITTPSSFRADVTLASG